MFPKTSLRVLVTRPREQASALANLLEASGATPIVIPTIEIAAPSSYRGLDHAITAVREYDWLLFTSANAVEFFAQRAEAMGLRPKPRRIAAIGPATAKAVRDRLKLEVDRMPKRYVAEDLVESLRDEAPGATMLLVRAAVARDVLPRALKAAGARVTIANAYRNIVPEGSVPMIKDLFSSDPPDAITFTSASTVNNLQTLLEAADLRVPDGTILASIGPITSEALRELGLKATVQAPEATIASLVESLLGFAAARTQLAG